MKGLGGNAEFGHIRVIEKNEFGVLVAGAQEDVWGCPGVGMVYVWDDGTCRGHQQGRDGKILGGEAVEGSADTPGHPLG